jgi:hypothetical protein
MTRARVVFSVIEAADQAATMGLGTAAFRLCKFFPCSSAPVLGSRYNRASEGEPKMEERASTPIHKIWLPPEFLNGLVERMGRSARDQHCRGRPRGRGLRDRDGAGSRSSQYPDGERWRPRACTRSATPRVGAGNLCRHAGASNPMPRVHAGPLCRSCGERRVRCRGWMQGICCRLGEVRCDPEGCLGARLATWPGNYANSHSISDLDVL